jgi:hypothetical protein
MISKQVRAIALRVVYHVQQKLPDLHGQPTRTLVMMVSAFMAVGGPWLSQMGRALADLPSTLQEKVKRMSRFLCQSEFDVDEAFEVMAQRVIEGVAHTHPGRMILVVVDWTDLGEYLGLWLSLPVQGRAIPLVCRVLPKESAEGSMTGEETSLVSHFLNLFPSDLRDRIVILADRGFGKRELFVEIQKCGGHFAIRLSRDRHVRIEKEWKELAGIPLSPGSTLTFRDVDYTEEHPFRCHLALRRLPVGEAHDPNDDTWYIATDANEISLALLWYERRFQIEEMFRDLKDRLNMDRHRLGTEQSLSKMMLIVTLAYRIILEDGGQWRSRIDLARIQKKTPWGRLSLYSISRACFDLCLEAPSQDVADVLVAPWSNRRAA